MIFSYPQLINVRYDTSYARSLRPDSPYGNAGWGCSNPVSNCSVAQTCAEMMAHRFTKKNRNLRLANSAVLRLPHALCFSGYICERCIPLQKPAVKCRRLGSRFLRQHAFRRLFAGGTQSHGARSFFASFHFRSGTDYKTVSRSLEAALF